MKIEISKIKISDRIRTDEGNMDALVADIKENGLISPIAVTQDYELLAGWRRLNACKKLGWTEIEANVMSVEDALAKLKIEISENNVREPFTFSENVRWIEMLKNEYQKRAEANSRANLKDSGSPSVSSETVGRVNQKVADELGLGSANKVYKTEYVAQHATPEMIKELDENQLSVNAAYQALKRDNAAKDKEIARLNSITEMQDELDEEASNKIDFLEMELQQTKEERDIYKKSVQTGDNSELRKKLSDTKLALRDMEEQKVAAEMLADQRKREVEKAKVERQMVMDSFDAYKARIAEKTDVSNSQLVELIAGINMISTLAESLTRIDTTNWSDDDRETAKSAVSGVVKTMKEIVR